VYLFLTLSRIAQKGKVIRATCDGRTDDPLKPNLTRPIHGFTRKHCHAGAWYNFTRICDILTDVPLVAVAGHVESMVMAPEQCLRAISALLRADGVAVEAMANAT
jgi:hypothetical protein